MKNPFMILALLIGATVIGSPSLFAQTSYSKVVTNDHPALYWNFDEASGNAKEVAPVTLPPSINDLVPMGSATRVSHVSLGDGLNLGNAASFQVGDYFIANSLAAATNALAGPWVLEFWMQVQGDLSFQRDNYLMNFGNGGGNSPAVLYDYVGAAEPREELELFGQGRSGAGPLVTDENWHHVLFAFYGKDTNGVVQRLDIYVDGTNAAQNVQGTFTAPVSLTRFVVGTSAPQFAAADGFQGNLDEVAVYNLASLTNTADVTTKVSAMASNHYSVAFSAGSYSQGVLSDNPMLYWNFDETNGNARQLAPVVLPLISNDLVANGGAVRVSHASINSGLGLGNAASIPKGGYFSIAQITYPTNALTPPYLMEFWVQVEGSQTNQRNNYILNFGQNAPAVLYDYVGGAQPRDGVELFRGGVGRTGSGPVITDSNWHHIVVANYGDGTTGVAARLDMYEDGVDVATNISATFDSTIALSSLVVGTSGAQFAVADGFEGNLDEVALYDLTSLTTEGAVTARAADISARHFAAAQLGPQPPSLSIVPTAGTLAISWNSSATGYALQSTPSLTTPTWSAVNTNPTVTNGVATVSVSITGQAQFFRLQK